MLDINMEFRKGILFVRLKGTLDKTTCVEFNNQLEIIFNKGDIKNVVFNIEGLDYIDMSGIKEILKYHMNLNKNNGKVLLCGVKNDLVKLRIKNSSILDLMFEISNELDAINIINM